MIAATLYFENNVDVGDLVGCIQGLPEPIRPIYFAEDEGKIVKANVLSNEARFEKFRKKNSTGFFLCAENNTLIDISTRRVGYVEVTLYLADGVSGEFASVFFKVLIDRKPFFGFACDEEEYDRRNRFYITIGKNRVESWIGLDLEKYIPGVYWYTLLSDELLSKHGVNLASLSAEAISKEALGDGSLHLLKFYEKPEDWKENAERLDERCKCTDGVFSRRSVEAAVSGMSNYLEYDDIIADWR